MSYRSYLTLCPLILLLIATTALAGDLPEIRKNGVLRHLGVPYANFVNSKGEGLDVDMMRLFASDLGVRYEYVPTSWSTVFSDLTGLKYTVENGHVLKTGKEEIKGDIIANGLTILPWRKELIDYSRPTFPTGIWVIAQAVSSLKPIQGSSSIDEDIEEVRGMLKGRQILTMTGTCLESSLYNLAETGAEIIVENPNEKTLDDMAPSVIEGNAELTLLDVPDALVALQIYPGEIKILGPLTKDQMMGCGFRKNSPLLREAFNKFFIKIAKEGTYRKLVEKHYPSVFVYLGDFFDSLQD
ncbi:MAG: transporter substrate-binding domain-containing protein [Desulfuromusa sp.]|nr:transporter substrate-binding domain-containing protein [Desulfuromusa sp.]